MHVVYRNFLGIRWHKLHDKGINVDLYRLYQKKPFSFSRDYESYCKYRPFGWFRIKIRCGYATNIIEQRTITTGAVYKYIVYSCLSLSRFYP